MPKLRLMDRTERNDYGCDIAPGITWSLEVSALNVLLPEIGDDMVVCVVDLDGDGLVDMESSDENEFIRTARELVRTLFIRLPYVNVRRGYSSE